MKTTFAVIPAEADQRGTIFSKGAVCASAKLGSCFGDAKPKAVTSSSTLAQMMFRKKFSIYT
jgi:hypothetical protein